ncbi:MAG: DUF1304 domain-containing protein [Pseudomonadales bacterium]|nr:DUF1304 domain-containing protein [Pseudomonadales bacterium]
MKIISEILVIVMALLHIYILVLEMFLWTTPYGLRAFGQTLESAQASRVLAANQGLYNGFLAAGLLWGVVQGPAGRPDEIFFLSCIAIAGIYGAATANLKILFIQFIPAAITLGWVLIT